MCKLRLVCDISTVARPSKEKAKLENETKRTEANPPQVFIASLGFLSSRGKILPAGRCGHWGSMTRAGAHREWLLREGTDSCRRPLTSPPSLGSPLGNSNGSSLIWVSAAYLFFFSGGSSTECQKGISTASAKAATEKSLKSKKKRGGKRYTHWRIWGLGELCLMIASEN